ncbi:metallophosphoesterase [Yoonia sp. GPGPB17]|uniref:metallophosphoesterase n=1 Tax=Yoonia sp. GPGPB17 TaxID=3026147 RepID=UPI0030C0870B
MQKILFISDPHICAQGETIIGLDPSERLEAVLEAAISAHPDAAALILLGDLTHHGHAAEYAELARNLSQVTIPIIPMIGNHDRRDAFLAQFPDAPKTTSGHIQQWRDIGTHRLITLDSLDGPPYPGGHHAGLLCPDRLSFLETALTTRSGRHAIVCIHHPPFKTGVIGMDRIMLANGAAVLDLLARHGNLHLVCGHMHQTISGNTNGVPWTVFKSPCHQGVVELVKHTSGLSTDEPGAYGLGLLAPDGLIIHSIDVGTGARVIDGYGAQREPRS